MLEELHRVAKFLENRFKKLIGKNLDATHRLLIASCYTEGERKKRKHCQGSTVSDAVNCSEAPSSGIRLG